MLMKFYEEFRAIAQSLGMSVVELQAAVGVRPDRGRVYLPTLVAARSYAEKQDPRTWRITMALQFYKIAEEFGINKALKLCHLRPCAWSRLMRGNATAWSPEAAIKVDAAFTSLGWAKPKARSHTATGKRIADMMRQFAPKPIPIEFRRSEVKQVGGAELWAKITVVVEGEAIFSRTAKCRYRAMESCLLALMEYGASWKIDRTKEAKKPPPLPPPNRYLIGEPILAILPKHPNGIKGVVTGEGPTIANIELSFGEIIRIRQGSLKLNSRRFGKITIMRGKDADKTRK